jgi:ubiquinone/menaquinone biosynthesis C-methylase UbiE
VSRRLPLPLPRPRPRRRSRGRRSAVVTTDRDGGPGRSRSRDDEPADPPSGDPSVRRTYDRIADHFASTREHAWPEVETFLEGRSGATGLDVGCGNGRHAELLAERATVVVGLDASRALLETARERASARGYADRLSPVVGDAARLPLRDATVDLGVYVATVHHLRPRARRLASLDELARVLAPGGRALVSAWSTVHDRFADRVDPDATTGLDTTVDWTLPGGERVPRFYHVYHPDEFDADLADSDLSTVESVVSSGNCYAVVGPGPDQ